MAVATGRAIASPPGPTTAVPVGLDAATPPMPAMDKATGRTSATDAPENRMEEPSVRILRHNGRGSVLGVSAAVTSSYARPVV
jgi:hypothetical protein